MEEKKVSNIPIYQPCWISYLGATSGVLKSLGRDHDIIDVGGYSGWSFLINVSKDITCPSGPTAHNAYDEIIKGTQAMGFRIGGYENHKSMGKIETDEDREIAREAFNEFKKIIDEKDRPVVLWGIPIPEYGIAYGYQGDSYQVSTFRHLNNQLDSHIRYDDLQAPGGIHFFSFEEGIGEITEKTDKEAIKRALKMTKGGPSITHETYVAGPEAFEEWARVLDEGSEDTHFYHGTSYVSECALEGRAIAVEFLKRLAKKYNGKPQAEKLKETANEFAKSRDLLKDFQSIFPFAFEGDMSKEKREKGAQILRKIKPHEQKAMELLNEVLEKWK